MSPPDIPDSFRKENVIPDVISEKTTTFDSALVVKWPNVELKEPGNELDREATQPEPTLYVTPPPKEKLDNYVLIMTDPDLMADNDTNFGQVRHWLATNISVKDDGELTIPKEGIISPYIGPAPLPNYVSPRPHRYVFVLSRKSGPGSSTVAVGNEDLQKLQKDYSAALEGPQNLQDLKDRWGFNAQKFMDGKGLKVETATFMKVGGTLKSTIDNMGMTAQAGVNKILGE